MRTGWDVLRAAAALLALSLAGCTAPPNSASSPSTKPAPSVFTFGTAANPAGLDPALVKDLDSTRITRQIFEGLVTVDPNNGKPAPALATSWKPLEEGFGYQFTIRQGVRFQDGTAFDAAAVCANFNRWFNYPVHTEPAAYPMVFKEVFKAFSDDANNSVYQSCTAPDNGTVVIALSSQLTGFLEALTDPAFGIASPTALSLHKADLLDRRAGAAPVSEFALNPVGTGPYRFVSWEGNTVTLTRHSAYWGWQGGQQEQSSHSQGQADTVRFVAYAQAQARLQALLRGQIDGYDFITTDNLNALVRGGFQVLQRDPFSVMYLGINQKNSVLANEKARQAAAMAIDKESLVKSYFIDGSAKTGQFIPPKLSGFNNQVAGLGYNQAEARRLLTESGYKSEPLEFYYPLNVTRPYLPMPEKVYAAISAQLTAVGFNIKPVPIDWSAGYLDRVNQGQGSAFFLLGSNGVYADPDNFLGPLFGSPNSALGFDDPQLISKVNRARGLPAGSERSEAYHEINRDLAQALPAVPIVFPISAVALSPKVAGYPISPVLNEVFSSIRLSS